MYPFAIFAKYDESHAYRLKVYGEGEQYVVQVGDKVRSVKAIEINNMSNVKEILKIKEVGYDKYQFKFCKNYLSAKTSDPGIIQTKYVEDNNVTWEMRPTKNGFKLYNEARNQCLTVTESFDEITKGLYLNRRVCDENLPNEFNLLDSGPLRNFCEQDAQQFCDELNRKNRRHRRSSPRGRSRRPKDRYDDDNSLDDEEKVPRKRRRPYSGQASRKKRGRWDSPDPITSDYEDDFGNESNDSGYYDDSDTLESGPRIKTYHGNKSEIEWHHPRFK